ncbi:unnamed protein product [Rotaria magnacalcarata]|uniref:CAP-Gly domain-containing protein n=1 Tax=Rotaria magnacalcarata TaxID=392030 RepID=A0A816YB83_9BILA|nr:unnamed protein product [Rotaria magnacalcarata]CAF2157046.1 unnamed protein product [Rotaria magnacalcarata]
MSTKVEKRSSFQDLIDDIIESPLSVYPIYSRLKDGGSKVFQNRNQTSRTSLFDKSKYEQIDNLMPTVTNDFRDRAAGTLPYSNSSTNTMSNEERRKEIDFIIKNLYDGKLSTINDDRTVSDVSEKSMSVLSKGPITKTATTTTAILKNDDRRKNTIGHFDLLPLDGDILIHERELQEKELDIIHLHKEIQELQLENKLLKAKVPTTQSNGYASNNSEVDALRREKDILQNELHTSQELIAKFQQQQYQNILVNRSNKVDEISAQHKVALQNKLRVYEKQMRALTDENDRLKQNLQQSERTIAQYKKEKEELQQQVTEGKKRNDELFHQEFHSFRNDLKMLKQRNNELFEENLHLQQEKRGLNFHSLNQEQQPNSSSPPVKISNLELKHLKTTRSESSNMSEASDSTNYLATVSIDRYHPRSSSAAHRSITIDGNNYSRTKKYNSLIGQDDLSRNIYLSPTFNSVDQSHNYRLSKIHHFTAWNDESTQKNEDIANYDDDDDDDRPTMDNTKPPLSSPHNYQQTHPIHRNASFKEVQQNSHRSMYNNTNNQCDPRHSRKSTETIVSRRPFAPSSISDIHVNDLVKFTRPGGKISKGAVKYVGSLPDRNDQYLGLELEDEETKHDGIYQNKRLFQCKPNKGIFIAFNKVIMAWGKA